MEIKRRKTVKDKKSPVAEKDITKKARVIAKVKPQGKEKAVFWLGLHNLKAPAGSNKKRKLLGRGSGSGHGKTSTRGSKGQTSRSGRDFYLGFEGGQTPLIRRIPKRGFVSRFKKEYQIVNLKALNRIRETNITLELLERYGLIKDKSRLVKILGDGEIKNPITLETHAISQKAADKIKGLGGKIELVSPAPLHKYSGAKGQKTTV